MNSFCNSEVKIQYRRGCLKLRSRQNILEIEIQKPSTWLGTFTTLFMDKPEHMAKVNILQGIPQGHSIQIHMMKERREKT